MKKTIKITALAVLITLIISVCCACEIEFNNGENTTVPTTDSADSTTLSTSAGTTETEPTVDKVETDSLETILNLIKDYPIGTAGSTMKAYEIAYRLLNFTQNSNYRIDDVTTDYNNFLSTLSDTQKLIYMDNLAEIDAVARNIINNPASLDNYLDSYEPISENGSISLSNYEALYTIISK
jgi:hypothetical protein